MTDTNKFEEIKNLLDLGEYEEAQRIISDIAVEELSEQEKGAFYTELAFISVQLQNVVDEEKIALMDELLAKLKEIENSERRVEEELAIASARLRLKQN